MPSSLISKSNERTSLIEKASEEIRDHITSFMNTSSKKEPLAFEVLNAKPGHGKTEALKHTLKNMIQSDSAKQGLLIALREKEHMQEVIAYINKENPDAVFYIDADNYQEVKNQISEHQFVLISHQRLKNLALRFEDDKENNIERFLQWNSSQRYIIIDEAPSFMNSANFQVDSNLNWLDHCFTAAKGQFSSEEKIILRSLIQILFAKELLENESALTRALKNQIQDENLLKLLHKFFSIIDEKKTSIEPTESYTTYYWVRELFFEENAGYIDRGFYKTSFSRHKNILCSKRIDYRLLGCSILILDGTAHQTPALYNNEYKLIETVDYLNYSRLTVHQRVLNTSAESRNDKRNIAQKAIVEDLKLLSTKETMPFLLPHKNEIKKFIKLEVLSKANYEYYFMENYETNSLPLHLLNTTGKNHLVDQSSIYLTSLPIRASEYYKLLAISLHTTKDLNLQTNMNSKKGAWFKDDRLETIFKELLVAELTQVILRSNLRKLDGTSNVDIYIATHLSDIMEQLETSFPFAVPFHRYNLKSKFITSQRVNKYAKPFVAKLKNIANHDCNSFPIRIGNLDKQFKGYFHRTRENPEEYELLSRYFTDNNFQLIEIETSPGNFETRVAILNDKQANRL